MPKPLDQWGEKFMREQPFMAFGSLMNAYAQMNQQKPKDLKEFIEDGEKLFELAQRLARKSFNDAQPQDKEQQDIEL